jgi:hypothetical protein
VVVILKWKPDPDEHLRIGRVHRIEDWAVFAAPPQVLQRVKCEATLLALGTVAVRAA